MLSCLKLRCCCVVCCCSPFAFFRGTRVETTNVDSKGNGGQHSVSQVVTKAVRPHLANGCNQSGQTLCTKTRVVKSDETDPQLARVKRLPSNAVGENTNTSIIGWVEKSSQAHSMMSEKPSHAHSMMSSRASLHEIGSRAACTNK